MNPDLNGDGQVTDQETLITERRLRVQRRIAIIAFAMNIIVAGILIGAALTGITEQKATQLENLLAMWWVGSWGIVATYFGTSTWLNRR